MTVLQDSLTKCRMPVWRARDKHSREKMEALEEYMLLTAFYRGELAEERAQALDDLDTLEDKYADIDTTYTYEGKPRTDRGLAAARREADPDTCKKLDAAQKLVKRLTDEMERLDRDATVASRVYTIITGS